MVETSFVRSGFGLVALALVPAALSAGLALAAPSGTGVRNANALTDATALAVPKSISGPVRVVDGDTLDIGATRVRLEGIDAPEAGQTCPARYLGGALGPWNCGQAATSRLRHLTTLTTVTCEPTGSDTHGRTLAICYAAGRDLNAELVRAGLAWAFVKYSDRYVREEAEARRRRLGIWESPEAPQPAWEYRSLRWTLAATGAPEGCAIKGNISEGGHIYHTPWSPWYDKVSIDIARGERWFCDEAEAIKAGWRAAVVR
ncbi:MAG: thermonuclease family protein [Hyphomicrobiaceae bacterium]|nr:thermonuclease family protein [Hyphomicrobiaceae bacterium]